MTSLDSLSNMIGGQSHEYPSGGCGGGVCRELDPGTPLPNKLAHVLLSVPPSPSPMTTIYLKPPHASLHRAGPLALGEGSRFNYNENNMQLRYERKEIAYTNYGAQACHR